MAVECLQTVGAKAIIAHSETLHRAIQAADLVGIPHSHIFLLDKNPVEGFESVHSAMWSHQELAAPIEMTEEELETIPCYFYYTSGTTGKKKAVAITLVVSFYIHAKKKRGNLFSHVTVKKLGKKI